MCMTSLGNSVPCRHLSKGKMALSLFVIIGIFVGLLPFGTSAQPKVRCKRIEVQFPSKRPFPIPIIWRGLIPLQSTRSDVEKVMGKPKIAGLGPSDTYENQTERLDVIYARDRCKSAIGDWNVPANTVIQIEVIPSKSLLLEDLTFDKSKYSVRNWSHPSDWKTYTNAEEGISLETTNLGKNTEIVRIVRYSPKPSDQALKCNNP